MHPLSDCMEEEDLCYDILPAGCIMCHLPDASSCLAVPNTMYIAGTTSSRAVRCESQKAECQGIDTQATCTLDGSVRLMRCSSKEVPGMSAYVTHSDPTQAHSLQWPMM